MNTKYRNLAQYFPVIREEAQIRKEIATNERLSEVFESWRKDQQDDFLAICSGAKGVKMLYDSFFKEILNPETTPERLSNLLSVLIGRKVTVKYQLPNDNSRLGDELSLIITDIVVELEDGTIANVEVQKLGYAFTGERASCYSADLLLRQYKRVRDTMKESFTYKDVHPVYTIVFLETSPKVFK
ncbi:MAG: PD-(D/E)XK nuclease family transposase, partial [Butyrivibrio sp.]|nr:PD-(D/E)XK nuclease family transposase [Butyrivibrio sp.]